MADEEKLGELEKTYRRLRWLRLFRAFIPDWIRVPFLRASTRWKADRALSEFATKREQYLKTYDAYPADEDEESKKIIDSMQTQFNDLQNALAAAETDWYSSRARNQRIPLPSGEENWEGEAFFDARLKPEPLQELKEAVIKAERETWKHRREWMAFIFAVLFGVVTAVSVFYNILSTQRRLNDIQGKLNDTQSVLADTQAKLYDAQRKLTDLSEQVRRRELTAGKRGMLTSKSARRSPAPQR